MPRFFFTVQNTSTPTLAPDTEGEVLPDNEAAWKEATMIAGELFKDLDGKLRPDQGWGLEVTDEGHKPLFHIQITTKKMD